MIIHSALRCSNNRFLGVDGNWPSLFITTWRGTHFHGFLPDTRDGARATMSKTLTISLAMSLFDKTGGDCAMCPNDLLMIGANPCRNNEVYGFSCLRPCPQMWCPRNSKWMDALMIRALPHYVHWCYSESRRGGSRKYGPILVTKFRIEL